MSELMLLTPTDLYAQQVMLYKEEMKPRRGQLSKTAEYWKMKLLIQ